MGFRWRAAPKASVSRRRSRSFNRFSWSSPLDAIFAVIFWAIGCLTVAAPDQHENHHRVTGLKTQFGKQVIHENFDLEVRRGEVLGVVGGSGTGKSVLLREIVGLQAVTHGTIEVLGTEVTSCGADAQKSCGSTGA
jgi:ABC-type glutathione transport system ATPase component